MKKLLKTIALTLLLASTLTLLSTGEVKAALQSNQATQYKKSTLSIWLPLFRQMEQFGEALGLSEQYNTTTLLATSESNNLDSHMMKSTEYGAIAILSASAYGNPSNDNAITTTTGNNTGMMLNSSDWEYVAGGISTGVTFNGRDLRYVDNYLASYSNTAAKRGDGLGAATDINPGTRGWHQGTFAWILLTSHVFVRGGLAGIFSYTNSNGSHSLYARGVIVCGEGL